MEQKYEAVLEPTDTWAIFDVATGEPAVLENRLLIGLRKEEVEPLLAALNAQAEGNGKGKGSRSVA